MLSTEFKPCLAGAVIANQPPFKSDILLLQQLVSAPNDIYQELYLTTLYAFMELCQAIPVDVTQSTSKSLLEQRLSLTVAALKLRRGKMLPLNSDSETIAEQEPLWTYALFTAGLLWRLSDMQQQCNIELYKSAGERLGVWHPLSGSLAEPNTYYKIIAQPPAFILENTTFQALIVGKIIPTVGLRWLVEYPTVFNLWWEVITDQVQAKNILMFLLEDAAQQIGLVIEKPSSPLPIDSGDQNNTKPENNIEQSIEQAPACGMTSDQVWDAFNSWLITHLNDNSPLPLFLRIPQGLFVSVATLTLFIEEFPEYDSVQLLIEQLENCLLHNITSEEGAPEAKGSKAADNGASLKSLFFRYRPIHFEQRQVLEGVVIQEEHLSPILKAIQLQKNFTTDISS